MANTPNNVLPFPFSAVPGPQPQAGEDDLTDPQWVCKRVWNIQHRKEFNTAQKHRVIFNFVWNHENQKTDLKQAWMKILSNGKPYLNEMDRFKPRLLEVDAKNMEFTGYLWKTYGLDTLDPMTAHVISMLRNGAVASGLQRNLRRFSYWDKQNKTLYISTYDGYCYRINGDLDPFQGVAPQPVGAGSSVFKDDDGGAPCENPYLGNHKVLFKSLIDDLQYVPTTAGGMSPDLQRMCLSIWMFTIAFPDLMPTKPLLLVEGVPGSGKTLALQRIALALHGKHTPIQVPKQEDKDFAVKILRSPIAILDDINVSIPWLQDTLCSYATGAGWTKRKLFTDDDEHSIQPESFLAITTNNPTTFRQGQVADRCLIIRLERRGGDGFLSADQLFEKIREDRHEIFGEWLTWLNEIVAELRLHRPPVVTKTRMADFAHLAHVIARVLARPGGPDGDWSPAAVNEMLDCMQNERDALVMEEDPLIELLDRWLEVGSNHSREVSSADLHHELGAIARAGDKTVQFYRTPKTLATRLKTTSTQLASHFIITFDNNGPSGKTIFTVRRA